MDIDTDKIDETVLALLYLTLHEENRAWKSRDWDAMNRLHEKGFISNPDNPRRPWRQSWRICHTTASSPERSLRNGLLHRRIWPRTRRPPR
jgi:hypothetical protein